MRTVYITTGYGKVSMFKPGLPNFGLDLYCEIEPNKWVHASQLPNGYLAEQKEKGTLQHGIAFQGKLYDRLNVFDAAHRLIAVKNGLELKANAYVGGATAFKAQISNPLEELAKQIQSLIQKLRELRRVESEVRLAEVEALKSRVKKAKKTARKLEEEQTREEIKPEQVQPHPLDFLTDITRAYRGETLSTASLEMLAKAQCIADYAEENSDLMWNPEKMKALRSLLLQ